MIGRFGVVFITLVAALLFLVTAALAHSWYPPECCSGQDCSEVVDWRRIPSPDPTKLPSMEVTIELKHTDYSKIPNVVNTNRYTAIFPPDFPIRESKDNKMHACMRYFEYPPSPLCLFVPPGM